MLRARESITYKLSQQVVSPDSLPFNQRGCAQSMMTYSVDIPWRPLDVRALREVRGICVRETWIFRRLAFSINSKSMNCVEEVIGFMAKMPGGWPLPKSAPGKLSVFRGMWSPNATWVASGMYWSATTRERQTLDVGFVIHSGFSEVW